jgi:hypothetical protein
MLHRANGRGGRGGPVQLHPALRRAMLHRANGCDGCGGPVQLHPALRRAMLHRAHGRDGYGRPVQLYPALSRAMLHRAHGRNGPGGETGLRAVRLSHKPLLKMAISPPTFGGRMLAGLPWSSWLLIVLSIVPALVLVVLFYRARADD